MKKLLFLSLLLFSSYAGAKDLEKDVYRRNSLCNFFIGESDISSGYGQMVGDCLLKYVMSDKFNDHCFSQKFMSIGNTQYTREELNTIYQKVLEFTLILCHNRLDSVLNDSAEDKYENLEKRIPGLASRISAINVASYIGVTQETLCRIKSKQEDFLLF